MAAKKLNLSESYKKRICELAGMDSTLRLTQEDLNLVLKGYITAALWTEEEQLKDSYAEINPVLNQDEDEEDEEENDLEKLIRINSKIKNEPFDIFSEENIEPDSKIQAYLDIKNFLQLAGPAAVEAINENGLEQMGHDIWLSRNGHGAGFFDRNYEAETEKKLMDVARNLKMVDLYLTDYNQLAFSNA